jgi:hypothetical protein
LASDITFKVVYIDERIETSERSLHLIIEVLQKEGQWRAEKVLARTSNPKETLLEAVL